MLVNIKRLNVTGLEKIDLLISILKFVFCEYFYSIFNGSCLVSH